MKVHEIREFCWDGIPSRGASWLREEPIQLIWKQVILVPASGGFIVTLLTLLQTTTEHAPSLLDQHQHSSSSSSLSNHLKAAFRPFIKALSACVTLGTGNSLGPEGPSVEIGTSIAKGIATLFDKYPHTNLSLIAAGSAAGISSGSSFLLFFFFFFFYTVYVIMEYFLKFVYLLWILLWYHKTYVFLQIPMHEICIWLPNRKKLFGSDS